MPLVPSTNPHATATPPAPNAGPHLGPLRKSAYALGDVTLSTALSSMTLVYASFFLVQVAGLRPTLAGLIPLIGRVLDAVTDPLMGELSDRTRWAAGRRRPYFLIGALPFGLSFALLWTEIPSDSQWVLFAYYTAVYCLMSVAMTVVSVPYVALLPEMAVDYDERTSINTYRTIGSLVGTVAAVNVRTVSEAFGGDSVGFAWAGITYGVLVSLPWLAVHRAAFERPRAASRKKPLTLFATLRDVFRHRTFTQLTAIYIMGRIAMDLAGTLLILYTTFWLGRPGDFELVMMLFLGATALALPFWLALARGRDKAQVFLVGSVWWMFCSVGLLFIDPTFPRWILFVFVPLVGAGYAVVDLMPWSMVGEVIDEDELRNGDRREGVYNGVFTFLRKAGGAAGVFLAMSVLEQAGYQKGAEQSESAREAIRWMTALGPAFFLAVGVWLARTYPLTRAAHDRIVLQLEERRRAAE